MCYTWKQHQQGRWIQVRIGKERTAFTILTPVWRSKVIFRKTKRRIFNTSVRSVLLYGSKTWRVPKANSTKLQTFVNKCPRSIVGIHWPEVITNEELWTTTEQESINVQIRRQKWSWIGHTLRKTKCNVTTRLWDGTHGERGAFPGAAGGGR